IAARHRVAIADVALAVRRDIDAPLQEWPRAVEHSLRAQPELNEVDAVDVEAEALDTVDVAPLALLEILDQLAGVVEEVAQVEVGPQRQRILALLREVGRAERADAQIDRIDPRQPDFPAARRKPQIERSAEREDLIAFSRHEGFHAQIPI